MIKRIKVIVMVSFAIICILLMKRAFANNISSVEEFQNMMNGYGVWGPIILVLIQMLQVVIPVLPGYLGCAVGAVSYGALTGFVCNYVGICAGSILAFFIAEKYGKGFVTELFSERQYEKWARRISRIEAYDTFLFLATVLPFFPDDFLCYFSGLIRMDRSRFVKIIILGKPWCILVYSVVFGLIR